MEIRNGKVVDENSFKEKFKRKFEKAKTCIKEKSDSIKNTVLSAGMIIGGIYIIKKVCDISYSLGYKDGRISELVWATDNLITKNEESSN